jgi:transposase
VWVAISANPAMARAYSDDLRCKLLEAYEAGRGSLQELAKQFGVSWGYSKKIRAQQLKTGQKERPWQSRHGPASRLTPVVEQQLRSALRQQPDLTLAEMQQRLVDQTGVGISRSRLWVWFEQLGLRHKKKRFAPRSKRAGKTSGIGRRGGSR